MIDIKDRYFSLNYTLLLIIGLWPYNKSKFARLQLICCFSILITFVIFQLVTFITLNCTSDLVIKILPPTLTGIILTIIYNSFCVNAETVKYLMEQLQCIYNDLTDNDEISIVEGYGNNAKRYTTRLTILLMSGASIITAIQLMPSFFNIILPTNKSRQHYILFTMEYFIDQEKYYYILLLHINMIVFIGSITVLATGTMLIAYLQHACGMFKIASYRVENALKIHISQDKLLNENLIFKGIISAIDIHRKAISFSNHLISKFEMTFMFLILFGVLTLSLNIFRTFQILTLKYNAVELLIPLITATFMFVYMFFANFLGQAITDHYNDIFVTVYAVRWYTVPLHIQKIILFLLQRVYIWIYPSTGRYAVENAVTTLAPLSHPIYFFRECYSMRKGHMFNWYPVFFRVGTIMYLREMVDIIDQYFSLNRTLLLAIGIWPYQRSTLACFQSICFFSIEATYIVSQLIIFVTSEFTIDIAIKILSPTFACISFTLTYNSFYVNDKTVTYLMEQFQRIYDDIKDKNEFMIIEKYGNNAKYFTIALLMTLFFFASVHTSAQIWPNIFDVILFANKSRPRMQITTDCFVKQEQYFYLRQLYINVAVYLGIVAVIATGTLCNAYLYFICGMFKIASYRIENAIEIYTSQNVNLQKQSLIYAVDIHRKAIKFSEYLISKFEMSVMLLIIFGVITLSFNIFHTFQIVSTEYKYEQLILSVGFTFICTVYMFFSNYLGQKITDHNNDVYAAAYNVCWYTASLYIQKLIILLLQRGNKNFGLNVGGLFIASLECFATLVKASVSYFTVMYSTQ
ncbi:uncharacterized protein [Anoplolepis gracilipes]|uniref:uncharacterized protein n=1 Tax=Anoplolepis gracilipes TaxID=354296 RepID=UPI003B9F09D8